MFVFPHKFCRVLLPGSQKGLASSAQFSSQLHVKMILVYAIILITLQLFVLLSVKAGNVSETCQSSCGNRQHHVSYPFGFSRGCKIQLNCSENRMYIEKFEVRNLTSDGLFLDIPALCYRRVDSIQGLFAKNYGLTWQNALLLQNCSTEATFNGCKIPTSLIETRLDLDTCNAKSDNISCYSKPEKTSDLMSYENVSTAGCKYLFSSIVIDEGISGVSLEMSRVQLGWWLNDGNCKCSSNADCTNVSLNGDPLGYRCKCRDGFTGDGFKDGEGCRKVSNCNASKYLSGHCGGFTRFGVLIGGIIAGASLVAGLAFICYFVQRRSISARNRLSTKRLLSAAAGGSNIPFYTYREIERATSGFSETQRLGTGAYGTVYLGKLDSDEWVAIKNIKNRDSDSIEQVMNEIKLLSSVSHPNLVRLLGCCLEKGEQILVYEYMPNGTLSQHLQRERGKGLPWTLRLSIASETANAIAHLHTAMNPPIFHRDIKSSNILLDKNFNSKVADFGLSRLGFPEISHISTAPQGTPGYLDPQYHQNFHLSDKSDVYSFGVVLVEIITALKVVDFSRSHTEVNLAALAIDRIGKGCVDEIIDPFLEPNRDAWTLSSIHKLAELAFRCLAFHRDMRPSMIEVAEELEQIRLSGWASMDENIFIGSSVASTCSSPFNGSERSIGDTSVNKASVESKRLIVVQKPTEYLTTMSETKDSSPVCVHDPWLSERSSPSANSLLGNIVQ